MHPSSDSRSHTLPRRAPERRRLPLVVLLTLGVAAAGCHRNRETKEAQAARLEEERSAAVLRQSKITVLRTGGIAGTETEATVDGSNMSYAIVNRRACATGQSCPPPTDVGSGKMLESAARELFARVESEGIFGLKEDYGTSPTLRDGFVYVVTLRRGARTKTIRGDDATQPPELARIEAAVLQAVQRARGEQ